MKKTNPGFLLFCAMFILLVTTVQAQQITVSLTDSISQNIQKHFYIPSKGLYLEKNAAPDNENKYSWLWPLCAMVQAANEMEALQPEKDYMTVVVKAIDQYYNDEPPAPAYQDYVTSERKSSRFFDDNQWIGIAYLDAYQRNKKPFYLDKAKMIYKHMILAGLDTLAGGGLYWKEGDKTTKNTCSNGPGILLALQLYKITKDPQYLEMAQSLYTWTNKHLQSPEGIYYDNIKLPSLTVDKKFYTYNTGTMLQSNVLLYEITGNKKYLKEAQRVAKAGKAHFFKNGRLPGNYWFNAVLLRGYEALYKIDHNKGWINFFREDAKNVWATERNDDYLFGKRPVKELLDQGGMLEIYARLLRLEH